MPVVRILTLPFTFCWQWLTSIPKLLAIPVLTLSLLVGLYVLWFIVERPVAFAYAGDNCVSSLTFWPEAQQPTASSSFSVSYRQALELFGHKILAGQSCIAMQQPAEPGQHTLSLSPFKNWLAQTHYQIDVPQPPAVSMAALSKPIPLTKPVVLSLSAEDETFAYALQANDRESECEISPKSLECELTHLALEQGKSYEFAVARYFAEKPVETIAAKKAEILKATTVTETSIQPNEVVLSKPIEATIKFDKPIKDAVVALDKVKDGKLERLPSEMTVSEAEIKITFAELSRQTDFKITVDKLEAQDGSSLVEPYSLNFSTSGGPRVASVSIPRVGVALGATAVIRFDQPLLADQDVVSQIAVVGGNATVSRYGDTAIVRLAGLGKCTDFTIKVGNGIQSIYGISGNSAWSYGARTVCHTVEVFGYSAKGRPLLAYYFGSGSTTILYTGAIHGSEISSSYLMDNWINELEANARNLPSGRQIVVVPEINPDGVAAGSRNNAHNIDLNRNFDVSDWQSDITDTYGRPIPSGGGATPMSEPETKAIAALITKLRPRLTMNYHSIGGLVIANQAGSSSSLAQTYARLSGYGNATGQSSTTFDYAISGTLDDWMAEKLGLPSLLIELGSHTYSQFPSNKSAMWEMARW